ncbi:MAG: hypothetical protein AAGE01_00680 [Pseudomonadota bacterium]
MSESITSSVSGRGGTGGVLNRVTKKGVIGQTLTNWEHRFSAIRRYLAAAGLRRVRRRRILTITGFLNDFRARRPRGGRMRESGRASVHVDISTGNPPAIPFLGPTERTAVPGMPGHLEAR